MENEESMKWILEVWEDTLRTHGNVSVSAEDDVALVDHRLQRLALTDPYIAVSYSGVEGLTDLIYAEYNPVFFQDIIFNIEVWF